MELAGAEGGGWPGDGEEGKSRAKNLAGRGGGSEFEKGFAKGEPQFKFDGDSGNDWGVRGQVQWRNLARMSTLDSVRRGVEFPQGVGAPQCDGEVHGAVD